MMRWITGLVVVVLAVVIVPAAISQMESTQRVYTYVGQFQVPRANWAAYAEDTDKTFVPVAEKALADGTIVSWSTFEHIIHTPDGSALTTTQFGTLTAAQIGALTGAQLGALSTTNIAALTTSQLAGVTTAGSAGST